VEPQSATDRIINSVHSRSRTRKTTYEYKISNQKLSEEKGFTPNESEEHKSHDSQLRYKEQKCTKVTRIMKIGE